MDNVKTGAFIKALRTGKGLTQRELAERLHITDRAVSKWERGLSAPDIALLEPLAEALEVSVVELIRGERIPPDQPPAVEAHARDLLAYSGEEARRRESSAWRRAALILGCALAVLAFLAGFMGWQTGAFFLLDDCPSPDGRFPTKVYGKRLYSNGFFTSFTWEDCVTLTEDRRNCSMYPGTTYKGLWWSPDSRKYVLALEDDQDGRTRMYVEWLYTSVCGNLNAMIHDGMAGSRLREDYGLPWVDQVELEFVQWGPDGDTMLVWYSFTGEKDGLEHFGYFWYDCELVCISGLFELDAERESDFPFSPSAPF